MLFFPHRPMYNIFCIRIEVVSFSVVKLVRHKIWYSSEEKWVSGQVAGVEILLGRGLRLIGCEG